MHSWNDDWPYWALLYEAQSFIVKWFNRLALCHISTKEKYGTIRFECIHKNGKDVRFMRLRLFILRQIIRVACLKWPCITNEIMSDAVLFCFNERYEDMYWREL